MTFFSVGGNLSYQKLNFKAGINTVLHQFSKPLQKREEPYNHYAFSGRNLWNASIDYSYTCRNLHLFGKAAIDKDLHTATVSAVLISVDPKADLSFCIALFKKNINRFLAMHLLKILCL